ncbi:MAG: Trk system potassium uptake protein TrkG [Planctomycetes bacterium]|nr:Trk system potassium uptake protein TrkG [Planctomycetota bacterium]
MLGHFGLLFMLGGFATLTPLIALAAWPGEIRHAPAFAVPGATAAMAGWLMTRVFRPRPSHSLTMAEGGVVLVLAWGGISILSAIPLMATLGLNFTQAVFESVSGWTTTGLSVVDVTTAPKSVLLWRSIMQFLGGAGMAVALLSAGGGPLGQGFILAEGRGDQLVPNVRRSARLVAWIYGGYAVAGTIAYRLAGMDFFDSVNHTFAAISTGGFSTRPASIGAWDSPAVEAVSIALMLVGSFNFQTVHLALTRRWRAFLGNAEMQATFVLVPVSALVAMVFLWRTVYPTLGESFRHGVFETVSALTTTGFSLTAYSAWPATAVFVLIVLMLIGGHSGSTAGGLKQLRLHLFARTVGWEVKRILRPRSAIVVREFRMGADVQSAQPSHFTDLAAIGALYAACLAVSVTVCLCHGIDLQSAVFEMVSCLSTVGLSIGATTADTPAPVLWSGTAGMFLGRLEFLIVAVAIVKVVTDFAALRSGSR